MERITGDSLSPAVTAWTKSTSAEKNQGAVLSTIADLWRDGERSVASTRDNNQFEMNSSQTAYMESVKTDTSTSSSDDLVVTIDQLQAETLVEISVRELRPSSAQNVVTPIGAAGGSVLETTPKRETEDSSQPLTLTDITTTTTDTTITAVPLRGDNIMYFMQPQDISQTLASEEAQKTLVVRNVSAARDSGQVSTSYEPAYSLQFYKASLSSTQQKSSAVTAKIQTEISHNQSSPPGSQITSVQETTSQTSVSSSMEYMQEYTSAVFQNGEYCSMNQAISVHLVGTLNHTHRFNGHIPCEPGLASCPLITRGVKLSLFRSHMPFLLPS